MERERAKPYIFLDGKNRLSAMTDFDTRKYSTPTMPIIMGGINEPTPQTDTSP